MIRVECTCGKYMGHVKGISNGAISHGICSDCMRTLYKNDFEEKELEIIIKSAEVKNSKTHVYLEAVN